ncbi:transposase [Chloroflexi bacterium TSY]|nr:transposase [Chloroflexi bacterium TSY]
MTATRAHKIRLNPTDEQEVYFRKAAGTARFAYNWALNQWKGHKELFPEQPHGVMAIKKDLNHIKYSKFPWMLEVAKDVIENALANLGRALKNYFDSKEGKCEGPRVGFPRFKSKKHSKRSFGLNNDKFRVDGHWIRIPKLGWVNMAEELRFAGKIMSGVVSETGGKWYVSITVQIDQAEPIRHPVASVGIDLGLKTLATLSDGEAFENQKRLRSELNKLKRLNRELARRQEGSNRWWKTKRRLQRFHARIRNRRQDAIHKMTTQIAKTYRLVGLEALNVKGMQRNRRLALSVADAAMGEITRQLLYKSEWFGGTVQQIGRFYASSKTCNACSHINQDLTLSDRQWTCTGCGVIHDRDWNAAKNIEQEALRLVYA